MNALEQIRGGQTRWAESCGLGVDRHGYVASVAENLFRPLTDKALNEFCRAAGNELLDGPIGEPAKMRALESSSALVCNVFDQWRLRVPGQIGLAFGLDEDATEVHFEMEFPTGLRGTPPTLDLALISATGSICAVESKFCEPYRSMDKTKPFARSYFPTGAGLWTEKGLPRCQALAEDLNGGAIKFERLDVAQLLKHALGLFNQPKPAKLRCVWYEHPSPEAETVRKELACFAESCDTILGFRAFTYQEVFIGLGSAPDADAEHLEYLRARYFEVSNART